MSTSISTGFKYNGIHVIDSEWQIQDGGIFSVPIPFFINQWRYYGITVIVKDY